MAGEFKSEMFIDAQTARAFLGDGDVAWCPQSDWKCPGADPCTFPNGELPFKPCSKDHGIAAKWYTLAHRKGGVSGAPVLLLEACLPEESLLPLFKNGSIRVYKERQTVAFTKQLHPNNYPGLRWTVHRISPEQGEEILEFGCALLRGS